MSSNILPPPSTTASPSGSTLAPSALFVGLVALGLAIIPRIYFEVPPPWQDRSQPPQQVVEGGHTLEWKGLKVNIGGTVKDLPPPPVPKIAKAFAIATATTALVGIALVGIALGVVAARRERRFGLAGAAILLCIAALLWEYVVLGIVVGLAAIVILAVLKYLAG